MLRATCEEFCVKITNDTGRIWIIRNRRELANVGETLGGASLMCSSSLDWPEDVTEDLDVIDVCNIIRGNRVREDDINKMLEERNK